MPLRHQGRIYFLPFHDIVSRSEHQNVSTSRNPELIAELDCLLCTHHSSQRSTLESIFPSEGKVELERIQRRGQNLTADDVEAGKPFELRFAIVVHSSDKTKDSPH